jgi:hypothetical protein
MSTYSESHKKYYERNKERIKSQQLDRERKWLETPEGKYSVQKRHAKQRQIDWQFSFEEWWSMWEESGHWDNRGVGKGQYCMSRFGDRGPYSPTNCEIKLSTDNNLESYLRCGIDDLGRIKCLAGSSEK